MDSQEGFGWDAASYGYEEAPLDENDRALLAEPYHDRQWHAAHGMTRLSFPPRSFTTRASQYSLTMDGSRQQQLLGPSNFLTPRRVPVVERSSASIPLFLSSHEQSSSSSPTIYAPSSPSFQVSQRKASRNRCTTDDQAPAAVLAETPHSLKYPVQDQEHCPDSGTPVVQGISLVSSQQLPDRFRSAFPFKLFNAIQSKCFHPVYKSSVNIVLSAPTGSGKTVILELAICQLIGSIQSGDYKIIYMAPTKSLCSERYRDWDLKFSGLGLKCAELTGDTDQTRLKNVQGANIIITTPEKWDSMTRKWKDHAKLLQLVKLFLIDEVHILKEARGAALEAVVSRMKSVGSAIRFIALSATVPNPEDIASWLGQDCYNQHLPARREVFNEEFRPVKLVKYVYGIPSRANDFSFDKICNTKLPEIVAKHAAKKPIMVFCCTRKSTESTAKMLAELWTASSARDRQWPAPKNTLTVYHQDLGKLIVSGVAFHHAGLDVKDRGVVEKAYLCGDVSVICCTSTLAVGVNLPCHLVIIKNTVAWQDGGLQEYADLEMMQMLGRAGRPQFDKNAIAVILTKQEKALKYERLVSGKELLESCLHLNLIDHLNAEIGLGTIQSIQTAKQWLSGTFLYVRLAQNPSHYKLEGDVVDRSLDDSIGQICERDIQLLQDAGLVSANEPLRCTEIGDAMARYYVKFRTMKEILALPPRPKLSEILTVLAQSEEFHEVRLRSGEKPLYKAFNAANGIRFPIKVDITLAAQKRSIIIQTELGGVEYPPDEQLVNQKTQYQQDKGIIFMNIHRLIRCIADCQLYQRDAPGMRHALELGRSLGARVWDNSPLQMKQIPNIGPVAVRKLVAAGVNSIELLETSEPHRINTILSKQPSFGNSVLVTLRGFPKLRVSIKNIGHEAKSGRCPILRFKAELGFINEVVPAFFNKKPVYVCFLAERSDGYLIDFRRISAKNVTREELYLSAELVNDSQYITCYVMCDEIAGTLQHAELKPGLSASKFPPKLQATLIPESRDSSENKRNAARRSMSRNGFCSALDVINKGDDLFDADIGDADMIAAVDSVEFKPLEEFENVGANISKRRVITNERDTCSDESESTSVRQIGSIQASKGQPWEPKRLGNGKWACKHKCKDKTLCKHLCCREGLDNVPKASKKASKNIDHQVKIEHPAQTKSQSRISSNQLARTLDSSDIETIDLSSGQVGVRSVQHGPHSQNRLNKLHQNAVKGPLVPTIANKKPQYSYSKGEEPNVPFLNRGSHTAETTGQDSSDYEAGWMDDLPSPSVLLEGLQPGGLKRTDQENINENGTDLGWGSTTIEPHQPVSTTGPEYSSGVVVDEPSTRASADFHSSPYPTHCQQLSFADSRLKERRHDESIDSSLEARARLTSRSVDYGSHGIGEEMTKTSEQPTYLEDSPRPFKMRRIEENPPISIQHPAREEGSRPQDALGLKPQPFRNMEGIDLDLLAQFQDIVEFVE